MARSVRVGVLAIVALVAACKADEPALTDANSGLDARCTGPHSDQLLDFFPSSLAMPNAALGAPDGAAVALAPNSVLTVGFIGLGAITDAAGVDLRIVATIEPGANALVRVAQADQMFIYTGTLDEGHNVFDLGVAMITSAVYVRVLGTQGTVRIDALEAVHDVCR